MKQKYSLLCLAFLSAVLMAGIPQSVSSQVTAGIRLGKIQRNKVANASHVPKDAVEDVTKRTLYNSTWRCKDGKIITCTSSEPINYLDANGNFQPVNIGLKSDAKGWVAAEQEHPCYFRSDRSTAISVGNGMEFEFNKNCAVNGMAFDEQINNMDNQNIALNLAEGVHKNIRFVHNGIKTNYVFDKPLEGGIYVTEELNIPSGCTLKRDETKGREWFGGWAGDYVLLSPSGQELARLYSPLVYDANNKKCAGSYKLELKDGKNILTTSVPNEWLAKAAFPITLDPLIKGAIVKHHGKDIGSCPSPAYSSDTLLNVTIPGKITIYALDIEYAYTTKDTFTYSVNLNAGGFYFSTKCGSNPTAGYYICDSAYPGICYLVSPNDLHEPLTCCYAPSCSQQTFDLMVHLTRFGYPLFGCNNIDYVWYDATDTAGIFTYKAYVEGYTDSVSSISYTPTTQCSNNCTLQMNANIEFGVPPYTVSHQWAVRDTVLTANYSRTCLSQQSLVMNLAIPSKYCPFTCLSPGRDTVISVPPPTIVDACGDTVKNLKAQNVTLRPVPALVTSPDTIAVCTGTPVTLNVTSCVTGTTFKWVGSDSVKGSGSTITDNTVDTGKGPLIVKYIIAGTANGCSASPDTAVGIINPFPVITLKGLMDTLDLGKSESLVATGGGTYLWSPAAGLSCTTCPNPTATPTVTTNYQVEVTDSEGCSKIFAFTIIVLDENISIPNVITPNNPGSDGVDNVFFINGLQYYPNPQLTIFDRWGKQIYSSNNYQNNWNGGGQSDGVYYYLLTLPTGKKFKGYFEIIK